MHYVVDEAPRASARVILAKESELNKPKKPNVLNLSVAIPLSVFPQSGDEFPIPPLRARYSPHRQ